MESREWNTVPEEEGAERRAKNGWSEILHLEGFHSLQTEHKEMELPLCITILNESKMGKAELLLA